LVFTTAVFGVVLEIHINQFKYLNAKKIRKIGFSTGESAKSG